jgi:two-component system chemotaxis sensor kinase CheA
MNEVIHDFILETQENLTQLNIDLVTLEKDPTERETLARIFRTFHTVKGTAGFLGLMKLQAVAHSAENLLSRMTAGELTFNNDIATALLSTVDTIQAMLGSIEKTEQEGEGDYSALIQTLERLRTAEKNKGPRQQSQTAVPVFPGVSPLAKPAPAPSPPPPEPKVEKSEPPPARTKIPRPKMPPAMASDWPEQSAAKQPVYVDSSAITPPGPLDIGPELLVDSEPVMVDVGPDYPQTNGSYSGKPPAHPPIAPPSAGVPDEPAPQPAKLHSPAVSESSIRVDVGLLDKLMNLVGELVLTRNQIVQYGAAHEDSEFQATVQRLNGLTTELQAGVMKTRMQPIGTVWSKFPRLVRDMAAAIGKEIEFDMQGKDTELDKTIIEAIRDPLTHMIRNAIDHGIEAPAERKKRGKPDKGSVSLNAFHEGGKVIIEVADDGGGIDPQRIRKKAVQSKLITPAQAAQMSKRELLNLIFHPGFSTADKVTHFSGRGVGMNVVQANLEMIGGTVDIDTCVGLGTTFKIKIPLTLAIIPALTITTGGDCYAIPQINLQELVRLEAEQIERGIEHIHGTPVYRLRGNLLPLVDLNELLHIESARPATAGLNIIVLQADDRSFGLIVDEIHDTQEIVVKPLQKAIKGINAYAGATIMGDGKVALILDVLGLAQRANVVSIVRERAVPEKPSADVGSEELRHTLIVFAAPGDRRMAVPIEEVARLEEFPRAKLDKVGNQDVVLYRDELLTLIDVSRALGISHEDRRGVIDGIAWQKDAADTVQIIVHAWEGRLVGLVIGRILDIVESVVVTRPRLTQPCVLFTAIIEGRATEVLDIDALIRLANPEFFEQQQEVAEEV